MDRTLITVALAGLVFLPAQAAERPTNEHVAQLYVSGTTVRSPPAVRLRRLDLPGPWEGTDAGFYEFVSGFWGPGSFLLYANGAVRDHGNFPSAGYNLSFIRQIGRDYYYNFTEGSGNVVGYLLKLTEENGRIRARTLSSSSLGRGGEGMTFKVTAAPDGSVQLSMEQIWLRETTVLSLGKLVESPEEVLQVIAANGTLLAPLPALTGPTSYETSFHRWIPEYRLATVYHPLPPSINSREESVPSLYLYRAASGKWLPLHGVDELNELLRTEITTRAEAEEFVTAAFRTLATRVLAGHSSTSLVQRDSPGGIWRLQTPENQPRLLPYEIAPKQTIEGDRWNLEYNVLTQAGAIRRLRLAGRLEPFQIDSHASELLEPAGTFRPMR
jgi:hypothetical protein